LPGADLESSQKICNDLRLQFSRNYFTVNEQKVHVTISVGISYFNGSNDINSILIQADKALYKAKENGRNQVVVFDETVILS